jgi:8-oxo-dGTP pyrophosphatase MutT (NUDIX family)
MMMNNRKILNRQTDQTIKVFEKIALLAPEPPSRGKKPSAVLMALIDDGTGVKIIMTERSSGLRHHAGQISFPGGQIDDGETALDAALREAEEEIGLMPADVDILGYLPGVITTANFHIAPVLGVVRRWPNLTPARDEVARILIEDIAPLLNPDHFERQSNSHQGNSHQGRDYETWVIRHPQEYIWGATATMLIQCAALFHDEDKGETMSSSKGAA